MKKKIGYILMVIGVLDFALSWVGINFYAIFGINLTGIAYEYSPLIVGVIGFLLTKQVEMNEKSSQILGEDEYFVLNITVNVKGENILKPETGKFFITNKKVGFIGSYVASGDDVEDGSGENDFTCSVDEITSVDSSPASVNIAYSDKEFAFMPGLTKVKSTVEALKGLINNPKTI